jgi:predicted DNA-binding transcriptional regulator AlpA
MDRHRYPSMYCVVLRRRQVGNAPSTSEYALYRVYKPAELPSPGPLSVVEGGRWTMQ